MAGKRAPRNPRRLEHTGRPVIVVRDECQELVARDSKTSPDFGPFPPTLLPHLSAPEWFDLLIAALPKEH